MTDSPEAITAREAQAKADAADADLAAADARIATAKTAREEFEARPSALDMTAADAELAFKAALTPKPKLSRPVADILADATKPAPGLLGMSQRDADAVWNEWKRPK